MNSNEAARPRFSPLARKVIVLFVFVSLGIFFYAVAILEKAWKSRDWPHVSGTVTSARVVGSHDHRKAQIRYSYVVAGRTYSGSRIMIGPGPGTGGLGIAGPRQIVRRYPQGRSVSVFFDPNDPATAVLEPGVNRPVLLVLLIGIFFSLLGLFMLKAGGTAPVDSADAGEARSDSMKMAAPGVRRKERRRTSPGIRLDGTGRLLARLVLVSFVSVVGFIFFPQYRPYLERYGVISPERPLRSEPVKKADTGVPAPNQPKADLPLLAVGPGAGPPLSPQPVLTVRVDLGDDFVPVEGLVPASWAPGNDELLVRRPREIVKAPAPSDNGRRYGRLLLGAGDNRSFHFVLDRINGGDPLLYLDKNQNGDLTDDGEPFHNQGTGLFATRISLPWRRLAPGYGGEDPVYIWFFIRGDSWQQGAVSHYFQTQFAGRVKIDKTFYGVCVADRGRNDGDFTNDGLYVDLNRDGKFGPGEAVGPGRTVAISGRGYRFNVGW